MAAHGPRGGSSTPRPSSRLLEKLHSLEARVIADRAEFIDHRADVERAFAEMHGRSRSMEEELDARVTRASRLARDVHDQQVEYQSDADGRLQLLEQAMGDADGRLCSLHREVEALRLEVAAAATSLPWQRGSDRVAGAAATLEGPSACNSTVLNSTLSNISSDSSGSVLEAASSMIVATTAQLGGDHRWPSRPPVAGGASSADVARARDSESGCSARLTEAAALADAEFRAQLQARCDVALAQVSERYGELRAEFAAPPSQRAPPPASPEPPEGGGGGPGPAPAAGLEELRAAVAGIHSRVSETDRVVERLGEELHSVVVELMQAPGAEDQVAKLQQEVIAAIRPQLCEEEEARQRSFQELRVELRSELAASRSRETAERHLVASGKCDASPPDGPGDEVLDPAARSFLELQRWIRDQKRGPRRGAAAGKVLGSSCSDSCGDLEERLDSTSELVGHSVLSGVAQAQWLLGNLRAELAAELTSGSGAALLRQEVQSATSACMRQALSEERSHWEDKFFSLQAQVLDCLAQHEAAQPPRSGARRVAVESARKP